MFRIFRLGVVALMLVAAVGLVGCEKAADKAAEEAAEALIGAETGVDVEVDDDGATIEFEDSETGESLTIESEATGLPDDFPSDFPVYEDADITSNSTITMEESSTYYVSQSTFDAYEDVLAWHEEAYADAGWNSVATNKIETDGLGSAVLSITKGESQATVVMAETEEGSVDIQLSVVWAN